MDDPLVTPQRDTRPSWTTTPLPGRPGDPFAGWSARRVLAMARRADRARIRGGVALESLAARHGLPARQLRLLAEGWAAGRQSGVAALGPAPEQSDPLTMLHARVAVETWAIRSYPGRTARADVWRNRVTIWLEERRRPGGSRPLAHLRLAPDGRWHLYRRGPHGDWWPVPQRCDGRDVYTALALVHNDPLRLFCPGAPREERRGN